MTVKIERPTVIQAAGTKPKLIEEFFGLVNSQTTQVSIARMQSPSGWVELVAPIGTHDRAAVEAALGELAAEGLVERHGTALLRARLPIAIGVAAG